MAKSEKTVIELDAEIAQLKRQREAAVKVLGNRIAETLIKKRGIKSVKGFNEWLTSVEELEAADAKAKADIKAEVELLTDPSLQSDDGPVEDVDGPDEKTVIVGTPGGGPVIEDFGEDENSQH